MANQHKAAVEAALDAADGLAALRLDGARNFRDIGGVRSWDGRRVRRGLVFRSEHLAHLTDADVEALRHTGVRLICDLRSAHERKRLPSRLPVGANAPQLLVLAINEDSNAAHEHFIARIAQDPSPAGAIAAMMDIYRGHAQAFSGKLVHLFDSIIDEDRLPAVVHCHAGKDRTGFATAMLLHALEVPMDAIVADYVATLRYYDAEAGVRSSGSLLAETLGQAVPRETLVAVLSVREEYLLAAFDSIEADYGSVDRYLEQTAGLTAERRARLKWRMLES